MGNSFEQKISSEEGKKREKNEWQIRWDSHTTTIQLRSLSTVPGNWTLSFQLKLECIQKSECILFLLQQIRQRREIEFSTLLSFVTLNCCHRESISHLAAEDATTSDRRKMAATFILMSSICVCVQSSSPALYVANCPKCFLFILFSISDGMTRWIIIIVSHLSLNQSVFVQSQQHLIFVHSLCLATFLNLWIYPSRRVSVPSHVFFADLLIVL